MYADLSVATSMMHHLAICKLSLLMKQYTENLFNRRLLYIIPPVLSQTVRLHRFSLQSSISSSYLRARRRRRHAVEAVISQRRKPWPDTRQAAQTSQRPRLPLNTRPRASLTTKRKYIFGDFFPHLEAAVFSRQH